MANPNIVTMADIHDRPEEIRRMVYEGKDMILTRRRKPFAYITPLSDAEKTPKGAKIMSLSEMRDNRDEFTFGIMGGQDIVLTYHRKKWALVSSNIPKEIREKLPKRIVVKRREA